VYIAEDGGTDSSPISPVLFLTVDGESMRFFLRPGPTKVQLQPIIKAGGGFVCRVQEPGTILLADPDEMGSNPGSAAHGYVSTQYIRDCVEKNQQLEVNVLSGSERKRGRTSGRMMYTPEDDAAILKYVSEHEGEVRGNTFWREMEKNGLTNHSWQSMKDRYRKYLRDRQPKNAASALEEKRGNSSEEDAGPQPSSPQGDSPLSSDITPVGAGTEERPVECATAASPQPETEQSSSGKAPPGPAQPDCTMTQWVPSKTKHRLSPDGGTQPQPVFEEAAVPPFPKRARSDSGTVMVEVVLDKLTYQSPGITRPTALQSRSVYNFLSFSLCRLFSLILSPSIKSSGSGTVTLNVLV
uniref:Telomeric repeat-binding factor 2-interacting protein 1 n=1 Tax=Esox lucius TaxID=8010 RepID=A0A6Q2X7M8_ESOLU